jgi:hypothetical protein
MVKLLSTQLANQQFGNLPRNNWGPTVSPPQNELHLSLMRQVWVLPHLHCSRELTSVLNALRSPCWLHQNPCEVSIQIIQHIMHRRAWTNTITKERCGFFMVLHSLNSLDDHFIANINLPMRCTTAIIMHSQEIFLLIFCSILIYLKLYFINVIYWNVGLMNAIIKK